MKPTPHFGDLQVASAQFLLVGPGETFRSKACVHHSHQPVPLQPHTNDQVEDADYHHGEQEEHQRGNQDDEVVHPGGLNHICGWRCNK